MRRAESINNGKRSPMIARTQNRLNNIRKNAKHGDVSAARADPVTLTGGFVLSSDGMDVNGRPSITHYVRAGDFIVWAEHGSPFWMADWLNYGDSRPEWKKLIEQQVNYGHHTPSTIERYKRVAHNVPRRRRRPKLSFGHHQAVEALAPEDQTLVLDKAEQNGLTVNETRAEARASRRSKVIEGQAVLEGQYRVILADCPWIYGQSASGSGAKEHYGGLTIEQLSKLPVAAHAMPNAVLFAWVTAPMLYEQPGPNEVIRAWGFTPKTGMVWHKRRHNFGNYVSIRHEHVIIATRGRCTPDRPTPMFDSVFTASDEQQFEHSEKPEDLRKMIERLYDGPYLELFGRKAVEAWTVYGNDPRLFFAEEVAGRR